LTRGAADQSVILGISEAATPDAWLSGAIVTHFDEIELEPLPPP